MFNRLRNSLGAKAVSVAVAMLLLGAGVAVALPDEAITGQATAEANQEAAEVKALAAQATAEANREAAGAEGVPEVVEVFLAGLETWVGCIQDGARTHADQQSNEETRIEDDGYDDAAKLELCGVKPVNPNDANVEDDAQRGRPVDAGKPDDAGRPADAGKPDDAGRPDDAGPDS